MSKKIKVVWICSFSNPRVREHYTIKVNPILRYILAKKGQQTGENMDSAIWNTNAITEFEKISEVELHIITPIRYLSKKEVRFSMNGNNYYFFREENSGLIRQLYHQLMTKHSSHFLKNRKIIKQLVAEIQPDIVHVMGAENPHYSLALLDVPENIPTIIQLQTLLDRLVNVTTDKYEKISFAYKAKLEREIILQADYIATVVDLFNEYIKKEIKPDAKLLNISLTMSNSISAETAHQVKIYDFVYFSVDISKAGDEALKAFAIAHKRNPKLTLNMVGGFRPEFRETLDLIIRENRLENNVFFEGKLPTREDVITQIRKSRYALLPLKIDLVPNTIREAVANGLPVITSITVGGTDTLNKDRESVLLSAQGDHKAMAQNMIALVESPELAKALIENAIITDQENHSTNEQIIKKWVEAYRSIVEDV